MHTQQTCLLVTLPKQTGHATGVSDAVLRKAERRDCAGDSMTARLELKEGSGAHKAESVLGRFGKVEGSMHKMLALLEHCLD